MTEATSPLMCQECGATGEDVLELDPDLILCEECESEGDYTYCTVCRCHMPWDEANTHRHLFESEGEEWIGTGGCEMNAEYEEEIRVSLFDLLTQMGPVFATDLVRTIEQQHMGYDALHLVTWLVLGPQMLFYYLDGEESAPFSSYGEQIMRVYERELEEASALVQEWTWRTREPRPRMDYGLWWLFGLDNTLTPEANSLTLAWITRWQHERVR